MTFLVVQSLSLDRLFYVIVQWLAVSRTPAGLVSHQSHWTLLFAHCFEVDERHRHATPLLLVHCFKVDGSCSPPVFRSQWTLFLRFFEAGWRRYSSSSASKLMDAAVPPLFAQCFEVKGSSFRLYLFQCFEVSGCLHVIARRLNVLE